MKDHVILLEELGGLRLHCSIFMWIASFFIRAHSIIIIIIIIIIINTFKHANFIKKLLMESPLRRRTTAD